MGRGRPPKFTEEQEQAIARRYATGDESMSAIAESLGTTRALIGQVITRQGVTTRHHQHALTPSQEEEVVKRFTEGATARDLEKHFGLDHTTINAIVRRRGGPLRRCGRPRRFESHEAWKRDPANRLRKLLQTARGGAAERGLVFEDALLDILPQNPPTNCACCNVVLDYTIYPRGVSERSRTPSADRCDNKVGYTVKNTYVVCLRCNRLKNDATLEDLQALAAYVARHLERLRAQASVSSS